MVINLIKIYHQPIHSFFVSSVDQLIVISKILTMLGSYFIRNYFDYLEYSKYSYYHYDNVTKP